MSTSTIRAAAPLCVECCEEFDPAFSPELKRCQRCAEFSAWFESAALLRGSPRQGKSVRMAGANELINRATRGKWEV